jgi:hypothetical protein
MKCGKGVGFQPRFDVGGAVEYTQVNLNEFGAGSEPPVTRKSALRNAEHFRHFVLREISIGIHQKFSSSLK